MSDKIKKILPSDVISESMDKINDNFDILNGLYAVDEYKWQKYTKAIDKKIEELKGQSNAKSTDLANKIDQIKDMYDNLSEINNIQEQVKYAIINASEEMEEFIGRMAGEQISEKMGDYAKTSDVDNNISAAFENFEASAEDQYASIINIAANSKFAKDSLGHLIDNTTGQTECETIEDYYRTLSNEDKEEINPDGKDLDDPEVLKNLVAYCETHLKTVVTELTSITQTVTSDRAAIGLVTTVSNNNPTASNLTAAIFMEANKEGSTIALNANNIKIISDNFKVNANGDHAVEVSGKITATSGTIGGITIASNAISASNFSVTSSGILTATNANITGAINATALTISGDASTALSSIVENIGTDLGWITEVSQYDETWLINSFDKTLSVGGLVLTGNIFAADSNGSVTAGMMGAGTNSNDLRFFAGSDVTTASSAPFRVYEDGSFVATSATISGDITADQFSATFTSASVTKNTVINGESFVISAAGSILDVNNEPVTISDNCLYIKIMDVVANTNPDINNGDGYLYGVPTLCMKYGNKEYILSPASWSDARQMYPTDMRWQRYYDICKCVFSDSLPSKSGNIYFDNGNGTVDTTVPIGTYYMFNDNPSNSYVTKTTDSVYKLNFTIDPRDQNVDTYAELLNQHRLISSKEVEVPDPVDPEDPYEIVPDMDSPARTILSRISGDPNPQTRIAITDENCGVYENYLLDDDIIISPEISLVSSNIWEQSGTDWNLWKIGYILNNLMISILNRNASKWTRGSSTNIHFDVTRLNPNTSATRTYATSASAEMIIHIYPQLNMYNFSTSSSTNKLLVECEFDTEVTYNGNPISEGDNGFNLYGGEYCLKYNFILDYESWRSINNIYEPFNDEDITDLYNKITSFLSNFDYSSISNLAYSFSGSIWGSNQEDEFEYSVSEHKA